MRYRALINIRYNRSRIAEGDTVDLDATDPGVIALEQRGRIAPVAEPEPERATQAPAPELPYSHPAENARDEPVAGRRRRRRAAGKESP